MLHVSRQNMQGKYFQGQKLIGTGFRGTNIHSTDFTDADLTNANFTNVRLLINTNLCQATLTDTCWDQVQNLHLILGDLRDRE